MSTNPEREKSGWFFPTAFVLIAVLIVGYIAMQWIRSPSTEPYGEHGHQHQAGDDHDHSNDNEHGHEHEQETDHDHDHGDDHEHEQEAEHEHGHEEAHQHKGEDEHQAESPVASSSESKSESSVAGSETFTVSPQAEKNIKLTTVKVKLQNFQRTITIPGRVVEQDGHSRVQVASPMSGIVEKILTIRGEAVHSGQPLFELKLTHEEVIRRQIELLRLAQQQKVVDRELQRLKKVTESGAIAGKRFLNQQYEAQKLQSDIDANKEGLLLLGLTKSQVQKIITDDDLVQNIVIKTPSSEKGHHEACTCEHLFQVAKIDVSVGQQVEAGETLEVLTDYCLLLIEGQALEQDAAELNEAIKEKTPITAIIELQQKKVEIPNLQILFIDSEVNTETRALRFYAYLPNEIINQVKSQSGREFIEWKFRPGQRVELFLPIESWADCVVLPREAVIQDGIESIVFIKKGKTVTRTPVVEKYRDARVVVLANDSILRPGQEVVANGAYQLFLKMKNRSAPIDPHAGHHH